MAALQIAAEDDAIISKSTVPLPVDAFSKRLDGMVMHLASKLVRDGVQLQGPAHAAEYLKNVLFGSLGFKVAPGDLEMYRPYRIYMHKVLTQRMATPSALGVLLAAFILRAQQAGVVDAFAVEVFVPPDRNVPEARNARTDERSVGEWCVPLLSCIPPNSFVCPEWCVSRTKAPSGPVVQGLQSSVLGSMHSAFLIFFYLEVFRLEMFSSALCHGSALVSALLLFSVGCCRFVAALHVSIASGLTLHGILRPFAVLCELHIYQPFHATFCCAA